MTESTPFRTQLRDRLSRLLFSLLDALLWLATHLGMRRAGTADYQLIPDVRYVARCAHPAQRLDIYCPKSGGGSLPVVMYVHGGGFNQCSRKTHASAAHALANRGYLVFMVDYRRAPEEPYPAAPHDVSMAYLWITRHAHLYGGDLQQLHLAGESAGGNLVCGLIIGACYQRPEPWMQRVWNTGVVPRSWHPLCAYLQVSGPQQYSYWRTRSLMGRIAYALVCAFSRGYLQNRYQTADESTLLADPLRFFGQATPPDRPLPPVMLSVGDHDVIRRDTSAMEAALRAMQVPPEARYYPGQIHGFQLLLGLPAARQFWADYQQFLNGTMTRATEPSGPAGALIDLPERAAATAG